MNKNKKKFIIILIVLLEFFVFPTLQIFYPNDRAVAAGPKETVINEIAWMGTLASANDEWMELFNNSDEQIDLTGWKLAAADGAPVIELSGHIAPRDYFLLERTSDDTIKDITADQVYVGSLSNNGEKLELKDSGGNIVDTVDCAAGWYAGDNITKASMERIDFSAIDPKDNWADNNGLVINGQDSKSNNIIGTPRAKNSVAKDEQAPVDTSQEDTTNEQTENQTTNNNSSNNTSPIISVINPGDLVINEFISDPSKGGNEWLEIYNNTNSNVILDDWTIEEGSGAKTNLAGIIPANSFFTVNSINGNLNNDGDVVILKDKDGRLIDSVAYGNWNDGDKTDNAPVAASPNSVARFTDGHNSNINLSDFIITSRPTKNDTNIVENQAKVISPVSQLTQGSKIIISEVFPNPIGDDSEAEFIELFNPGPDDVNLAGWEIIDESGKKYTFASSTASSMISENSFYILYRKQSKIALDNSKETLHLYEPDNTKTVSTVGYNKAVEGQSYNNLLAVDNDAKDNWAWSETVTPGQFNIIKQTNQQIKIDADKISSTEKTSSQVLTASISAPPAPKPIHKIFINELMPNPAGSDVNNEWIELFNPAEERINLLNWKLKNSANNNLKISSAVWLEPSAYYLLKNFGNKFSLKNTSDKIDLYNEDNMLVDSVVYSGVLQGASYAREENGKWVWITRPTPGTKNIVSSMVIAIANSSAVPSSDSTAKKSTAKAKKIRRALSLEQARIAFVGDLVITEGTVAVKPGVLGSQYFYIVGSPGLQIYNYNKLFPPLKVGDYVAVNGEISEISGEKRLKTKTASDIKIISGQKPPLAEAISCEDMSDDIVGKLIKISGEITDKKASTLYIDDGRDETIVYIKSSTGINLASIAEGDKLSITGIVSKSKNDYRLLPRSDGDIIKLSNTEGSKDPRVLGTTSASNEWSLAERDKKLELFKYLLVMAGGAIVALIILIIKLNKKKN